MHLVLSSSHLRTISLSLQNLCAVFVAKNQGANIMGSEHVKGKRKDRNTVSTAFNKIMLQFDLQKVDV